METKKTVLVADDHPDILLICKTILEEEGYAVRIARNGLEALKSIEDNKPHLIVLDIAMPEMDGLEVLSRLKGSSETSLIPVILLTAKSKHEDVIRGYNQNADYYITKPFTKEHLLNGVKLVLGDKALL